MPLFMLACFDKPQSLPLRMATREAHLAYAREHAGMIKVAGPMLDDADGMAGSLFVLEAPDRAAVQAFHEAAIALGLESLHGPQLWPDYAPAYYAAFVRDPDGNNIEAVTHSRG